MTTETQEVVPANVGTVVAPMTTLVNGDFLRGQVIRPYLRDGELLGAVLSFEGKTETALLHLRQLSGEKPKERLAEISVGDSLMVRIIVQQGAGKRKDVWATEKGVDLYLIVEMLDSNPELFRGLEGTVHSVTRFGTFVEVQNSPVRGHRGLLRPNSMSADGRVKLGSFLVFKPGDLVELDVAQARVDKDKLIVRLENVRPRMAA